MAGSAAELRWTSPEAIAAADVSPWTDLPVWAPPGSDFHAAIHAGDVSRARATGLECRPVTETVTDTWALQRSVPETGLTLADGLAEEAEARLLKG
ncbi:hypothetical protein [Streptomyces sp. NBC_01207]|uniref:hypothetical protein n=1 Tax=Streptomyces sp. NBC_01207 TaxID=2903772 RepID=UPI002E1642AC